jgi:SRSO17 transposase
MRGCAASLSYLRGLLAPLERKNGWHLAEAAGDVSPAAMQDFLTRTRWNADAVRNDLQDYVVEHLGDEAAVLVLDETGFVKKGTYSAGVKRQYSGTAGHIENCQGAVFPGYASCHGRALIDRALYLPVEWATEDERRLSGGQESVNLQDDLLPRTVPEIRQLLASLAGLPPPDRATVITWLLWRRRHQQCARRCHWKRRTQTDRDRL